MFSELIDIKSIFLLLNGALITLKICLGTIAISLFLGVTLGILSSNQINLFFVSKSINFITFIIRSIPNYVWVLFFYFVIPELTGVKFSIELAAIIALGMYSSGYISQIIRSGINSIDIGQWEAAFVHGFGKLKTLKLIILPQVIKHSLPVFLSEYNHTIKGTAAISSLGVLELTKNGMKLVSEGKSPLIIYPLVGIIYILISFCLICIGRLVERKVNYDLW